MLFVMTGRALTEQRDKANSHLAVRDIAGIQGTVEPCESMECACYFAVGFMREVVLRYSLELGSDHSAGICSQDGSCTPAVRCRAYFGGCQGAVGQLVEWLHCNVCGTYIIQVAPGIYAQVRPNGQPNVLVPPCSPVLKYEPCTPACSLHNRLMCHRPCSLAEGISSCR